MAILSDFDIFGQTLDSSGQLFNVGIHKVGTHFGGDYKVGSSKCRQFQNGGGSKWRWLQNASGCNMPVAKKFIISMINNCFIK